MFVSICKLNGWKAPRSFHRQPYRESVPPCTLLPFPRYLRLWSCSYTMFDRSSVCDFFFGLDHTPAKHEHTTTATNKMISYLFILIQLNLYFLSNAVYLYIIVCIYSNIPLQVWDFNQQNRKNFDFIYSVKLVLYIGADNYIKNPPFSVLLFTHGMISVSMC